MDLCFLPRTISRPTSMRHPRGCVLNTESFFTLTSKIRGMPCEQLDICSTRHFCRLRPRWRKCSPKCHGSPKKHARNQAIKATCMHVYSATRPYTMPITKTPPLPLDESPLVNREELGCLGNNSEILLPNNNIRFSLIFLGMHVSLGHGSCKGQPLV